MSQTNNTHTESGVKPYRGTGIRMETKLMQQFREATPVNHGIQGAAVRNKAGQVELFTVGSDQRVWNFYPDPTSDTGYRRADTGLKGDFIAAGLDHGGSIVLLARFGDGVNYAVKYMVKGKGKWSAVTKATLPLFPGYPTVKIRAIYARTIDGQLYVGVDGVTSGGGYPNGYQAVSQWNVNAGSFLTYLSPNDPAPLQMNPGMASFWTHSAASASPAFSVLLGIGPNMVSESFYTIDVSGKNIEVVALVDRKTLLLNVRSATVDIESPPDAVGRNKIFFVASDGTLYQLTDPTRNSRIPNARFYRPVSLSQGLNFVKVHAVHDHRGGTHLFCVSQNKEMYHLPPNSSLPNGYPQFVLPIKPHVDWVTLARNDAGNIELFYAEDTPAAHLIHGTLDQDTGDWEWRIVEVQGGGSPTEAEESGGTVNTDRIEPFISYSTDLSFTDPAGAPMVNTHVTVNASDRTGVTVNGATYSVDAITSASLKTNGAGQLTITQQTSGLSVPDLWVHVDRLIPPGEVLVLEQYANGRDDASLPRELKSIETRLKEMTGPDLANAKDASGQFLLKATIRSNSDSTTALANGFNSCMKLASKQPTATLHPLISREGAWTGVHIEPMAAAIERSRVTPHAGLPSWSLSFAEDGVQYRTHTPDEAQMIIAEMRVNANPATNDDGTSWWSTIGDFLEAIVEGFVNTVVEIKRIVVNGVTAAFEFVMNGVHYVFNAVVQFVQDSFDMIESILAAVYQSVEKFFEKTFEWIGFLLNWGDILRTRDALAYTITQGLKFVPLAITDVKQLVDGGFVKLNAAVQDAFAGLKLQVANSKLGGYAESNRRSDPVFMHSSGNNFVMNGLVNNAGAAKASSVSTAALDTGKIDILMTSLKQFEGHAKNTNEFSKVQDYMQTVGSAPDNIFTQLLSELIDLAQKLVEAVLSGVHDLIDKAFNALASLVTSIQDFLMEEWEIPFVTAFYRHITTDADHPNGSALTFLDLISLVIAIPSTTLYKILHGKPPFPASPGRPSVQDFTSSFTAQTMLDNFKGSATSADNMEGEVSSLGEPMVTFKSITGFCTAFAELCYWMMRGLNDASNPIRDPLPGGEARAKITLGFELASSCFSFPWFPWCSPLAAPHWKLEQPYEPTAAANAAWLWETFAGVLMIDGSCVLIGKHLPENWNDTGVVISLLYACYSTVFAGIACAGASHLDRAVGILPVVPNFIKLGRLTPIVLLTEGGSLVVVAAADLLFGGVIAVLTAAQGGSSYASQRMLTAHQSAA
jgi:hypothetical protein